VKAAEQHMIRCVSI